MPGMMETFDAETRASDVDSQTLSGEQSEDKKISKATLSVAIRWPTTPALDPDPDGTGTRSPINLSITSAKDVQVVESNVEKFIPENVTVVTNSTRSFPPSNVVGAIEGSAEGTEEGTSDG